MMRMLILLALLLCTLTGVARAGDATNPAHVFFVHDYGAVADGKTDDGPAIRKAIDAAKASGAPATVEFQGYKCYRVLERSDRWESFELIDCKDITIEGNGATLMLHPNARGFILQRAVNCTVRNFAIDYDPLPYTQSTVLAVDMNAGTMDVSLDDGYPAPPGQQWMKKNYIDVGWSGWRFGVVFGAKAAYAAWDSKVNHIMVDSVDKLPKPGRVYRITIRPDYIVHMKPIVPEDRFAFRVRYTPWSRNKALKGLSVSNFRVLESSDVTIEHIRQYTSPNQTMTLTDNLGRVTIRDYSVLLKPGTDRLCASLSDGIHCKNNRIGPIIENCHFEGLFDDSINISTMAETVLEVISPRKFKVQSAAIAWYIPPIDVGNEMLIINVNPVVERGLAKVVDVEYLAGHQRIITLDRDIPAAVAGANVHDHKATQFYNRSRCGADFIIRNNRFQYQTRSAMLIQSSGLIENNIINDVYGHGVLITNGLDFFEGPIPWDITLRGNRMVNVGHNTGIAISVGGANPGTTPLIRGLVIEDNTVEGIGYGNGMFLSNIENAIISGNTIRAGQLQNPRGNRNSPAMHLRWSKGLMIDDLHIEDLRSGVRAGIALSGMKAEDIALKNIDINLREGTPEVKTD